MDRISAWAEERSAPVAATVVMVVGVMAFSLLGHRALHIGRANLVAPSDLWSLATSSSAILHAHFADIYVRDGALTSPPALELVLVPVLALGQLLGLSPHLHTSGEPLSLWFVLGPAAVLLASTALFAIDAVARHWGLSEHRRLARRAGRWARCRQRRGRLGPPGGLRGRRPGGLGRADHGTWPFGRRAPRRPPPRRRHRLPAARSPRRRTGAGPPQLARRGAPVLASRVPEHRGPHPLAGRRDPPHPLRVGTPTVPAGVRLAHAADPSGTRHRARAPRRRPDPPDRRRSRRGPRSTGLPP